MAPRLLLRAAETVLQPVGVSLKELVSWMHGAPVGVSAPGLPVYLSGRSVYHEEHKVHEEERIERSEACALAHEGYAYRDIATNASEENPSVLLPQTVL